MKLLLFLFRNKFILIIILILIKFVSEITFLGISIKNNDVTDHNISKTFRKFYHKANQVMNDFKYIYRNINSQWLSSYMYCLDAYGS